MLRISAPAIRGGHTSHTRSLRKVALTTAFAVPVVFGLTAGFGMLSAPPQRYADVETTGSLPKPEPVIDAKLLDPTPMLGSNAARTFSAAPLASGMLPARPATATVPARPRLEPAATRSIPPVPAPAAEALRSSQAPQIVPLPVPRPPEFAATAPAAPAVARAPSRPRRTKAARMVPPPADERSWFEKLFDINSPTPPAVSYTALESRPVDLAPKPRLSPSPLPAPTADAGTAVYDITARTVTLPNGERLEAHSGLRGKMDDPRFVHVRMHGATPPGTYDLTEREALFHGVRAIRLNPVGGSGAIYGRTGILAHSYLLGPNGDSNGCVSFKDYDRFLQAFLRGEVRRLVVVAGNGQDRLPTTAMRRQGRPDLRDRDA
jgi:hypothetical protein